MVILKKFKNVNGGEGYMRNLCHYVTDGRALAIGGYGVNIRNTEEAIAQMLSVTRDFRKMGYNPVFHFMVSFDETVTDAQAAFQLARAIAKFFDSRHQYLFCVHEKDRQSLGFHCHIVVNSCSYVDGKMLRDDFVLMNRFGEYIKKVTGRPVRCVNGSE